MTLAGTFFEHFSNIKDPRIHNHNFRHNIFDMIVSRWRLIQLIRPKNELWEYKKGSVSTKMVVRKNYHRFREAPRHELILPQFPGVQIMSII